MFLCSQERLTATDAPLLLEIRRILMTSSADHSDVSTDSSTTRDYALDSDMFDRALDASAAHSLGKSYVDPLKKSGIHQQKCKLCV